MSAVNEKMEAQEGAVILFVADSPKVVRDSLGNLRIHLAKKLGLIDPKALAFTWVTEFPLVRLQRDGETVRLDAPSLHLAGSGGGPAHRNGSRKGSCPGL